MSFIFVVQAVDGSTDVRRVLQALSRQEYSWQELTSRPLPPGVDPARIELYLSDTAFQVATPLNPGWGGGGVRVFQC